MKKLKALKAQRTSLLAEAAKFRAADGTITDQAAFDAKTAEIETVTTKIRAIEEAIEAEEAEDPEPGEGDVTTERQRCIGIRGAFRAAKLTSAEDETLLEKLITDGTSLEQAGGMVLQRLADADKGKPKTDGVIVPGEDASEKRMRGLTNWLLIKGGGAKQVADAEKISVDKIDAGEFRGMTLLEIARQSLELSGMRVRGMSKMELVGHALTYRSATQSTSDFATLLENVMHKQLQAAYAVTPDTWRRFCATGSVTDFRDHNRYRLGSFGTLDALNENGEFKNKAITDAEKATVSATTKGNIINVSRAMIVNDDMGAFTSLLSRLGRAAGLSIEVDVYATLGLNGGLGPVIKNLDSVPLFDASHNNISTGAAISATSIDADRVLMAQQKDKDGNEVLDLRPSILVIAVGLGGAARQINRAEFTDFNRGKPNPVMGLFSDIVDTARLSGTRRYLFADPAIAPVLEVDFLEGQEAPVLETKDGWRVDGAEMKVRFDYGVAAVDYRGAVTNAGA